MIPTTLALPVLAALLAGAPLLFWQDAHWTLVLGTALAAGAPVVYLLVHCWRQRLPEGHPLLVSIASGLGCVSVMLAIERFGSRHDWALYTSAAALIVWMLWQRGQRIEPRP